jgi:hypothetical protein
MTHCNRLAHNVGRALLLLGMLACGTMPVTAQRLDLAVIAPDSGDGGLIALHLRKRRGE